MRGIKSTQYEEQGGILLALINRLSTNFHYQSDKYSPKGQLQKLMEKALEKETREHD